MANLPASHYVKFEGHDKWWFSEPDAEKILLQSEEGIANYEKGVPLCTLHDLFTGAVKHNGNQIALRSEMMPPLKKGEKPPPPKPLNQWHTWTWEEYYQQSRKAAKAAIALGLKPHQSVCIFGFNSPEWCIAMFGAIFAGGTPAGIYPSDTEDTLRYKADQSDTVIAVVENLTNFEKVKSVADQIPTLQAIVSWGEDPGEDLKLADGREIKTFTFEQFLKLGESQEEAELDKRIANIRPGHTAALIYTSGTTGRPKATMVCHDAMVLSLSVAFSQTNSIGVKNTEERNISYLPLSHIAGMMLDVVGPMGLSANIFGYKGYMSINFVRPYDIKAGTIVDRLTTIRPTIFFGVPRVWEKFMERMQAVGAKQKGMAKRIASHAKSRGLKYVSSRQIGQKPRTPFMGVANFVHRKIKERLGLDKAKCFFSGAAPMKRETLEYFAQLNIPVLEVYGMSESCGMACWSTPENYLWGTCGLESGGIEAKVLNITTGEEVPRCKDLFRPTEEEQGEICFRGRAIMTGYMANPRLGEEHIQQIAEKNKSAIDDKGWMHSGDKGARDERGVFRITGRYKELIVTAGGENVAPIPIEDAIKQVCPIISNIMMVGNKRKFNVVILTLKAVGATGELPGTDELSPPYNDTCKTITEARSNEKIIKMISDAINQVNGDQTVVVSNASKVQKFTILPRDFSIVTDELTATQKLKRSVVDDMYKPIIDKMYESKDMYVNYDEAPTPDLKMV